jgi:hypothetical protein
MNLLTIYFAADLLCDQRLLFKNSKLAIAVLFGGSSLWSYWRYELTGYGREIIAAFSSTANARRHAVIGAIMFFESLFGWVILAAIVVLKSTR